MNDKQDAARRLGETIEIEGEVRVGNSDVPTPVARVTPADLARWRAAADAATLARIAMPRLLDEVERLRETVTRLNRRAQIAESAINDLTREPIGGREHAPVAAEVWARCEETHGLVCRAAREARAEVSSLRTLLDPDGKATERLLEAPMMSPLEWAQKALGCARGGTGEGGDEHYCRTHPGLKRAWPCLRATRLAALIEARDCEVQANECEAIAAELSDEHREALFLGGANQPGTWGSVAARFRARADMHRGEPR